MTEDGGGAPKSSTQSNTKPRPGPKPLDERAFHGPLGEMVRSIEPQSEADPAAILIQGLAAAGSIVGRGPGFTVERTRHHCNLFVVVVGDTANARKGTSLGQAMFLFKELFPDWRDRICSGASSGEGLISVVKDRATDPEGDSEGEDDKRLFVVESELASVLERMGGQGNSLSPVLRQAWDGGKLDTLVKRYRVTATGAHITLVGHITVEELRRKLTSTEQANGFANRILWVYARRTQFLPRGGSLERADWTDIARRLEQALGKPHDGDLDLDEKAWRLWDSVYEDLTTSSPGLLGAVTARAESQVRRIATIYALLDGEGVVRVVHLEAALEVWRYCRESAAVIFGQSLGDTTADEVLRVLRETQHGMTRKQLHDHFSRHLSGPELSRVLALLEEQGLVKQIREKTGGRPASRYVAIPPGDDSDPSPKRKKRPKKPERGQ